MVDPFTFNEPVTPPARPLPYGRQHITEADVAAVVASLHGDYLTQGPTVAEFEAKFAAYVGARYAVAVANGTAALHLCALALGVAEELALLAVPATYRSAIGFAAILLMLTFRPRGLLGERA